MRDFTLSKYKQLLLNIKKAGYKFYNIAQYIENNGERNKKIAIIRHDIDTKYDLSIALNMAKFESRHNISASYYFRSIPDTYNAKVIKEIALLGHEIGYHYEVLSLCKGDYECAIKLFKNDLEKFRKIVPIKTICQHGGTLGKYSSTSFIGLIKTVLALVTGKIKLKYYPSIKLWEKYNYSEFAIIGDAYLSLDFKKIKYFSDTGLSWDSHSTRIVDNVDEGENTNIKAHKTDDLIEIIHKGKLDKINILVHPANWNDNFIIWLKWIILQKIRNAMKILLKQVKK